MASLRLILSTDPEFLLAAAAEGLLASRARNAARPFASPDHLLVLRHGGLRDDLLALAAARGVAGWFDPPVCVFPQLPDRLGATSLEPCGDYERIVLLSGVLREACPRVFGRLRHPDTFVDAVDRLFGELVAEGIAAEQFGAALESRADRDEFERARDDDLASAYVRYLELLARSGRRDGRDAILDCARALEEQPARLREAVAGRRGIRFVGLHDLRGGWRRLLHALRASDAFDDVAIYSAADPGLDGDLAPDTMEDLDPASTLASTLFLRTPGVAAASAAAAPSVVVLSAPDPEREVEEVARRVRAFVDAGASPHRIAVVARHARPYGDLALHALERFGLPVTARRRFAFAEIPVVRAILFLFAVAREGWTRHGLVELAEQPYLGTDLDGGVIQHIGYQRRVEGLAAWRGALAQLHERAKQREARLARGEEEEPGRPGARPPPSWRTERAIHAFDAFAARAAALDETRTLGAWLAWLRDLLSEDPWRIGAQLYRVPGGRERLSRLDALGLRGMRSILDEWSSALEQYGGGGHTLPVAEFEARLREMLSGEVAVWTETRRGVQVLEGFAAADRAFEHVFVLGLAGGRFPAAVPRSPIFDERDRDALVAAGLPVQSSGAWETRERELFRLLVATAKRTLTACFSRHDTLGAEVPRSVFIEELIERTGALVEEVATSRVLTPGLPLIEHTGTAEGALHAARVERLRATGETSPYNGRIEDPVLLSTLAAEFGDQRVWSPTQLEAYAKCPWSFFSARLLHLDRLEDPDLDIDPLLRGVLFHDALRRFYDRAVERAGGPVLLRDRDAEWAASLLEQSFADCLTDAGDDVWLGQPALREVRTLELRRMLLDYIAFEIEQNEALFDTSKYRSFRMLRTAVLRHELSFEDVVLRVSGVEIRYRGTIDRVEIGVDDRVESSQHLAAVDYKSSIYSTPGAGSPKAWADGVILQVPLYAHALAQLYEGSRVARVEYRAVRNRKVAHSLHLVKISKGRPSLEADAEARERMRGALEHAAAHVAAARAGRFPAAPAPSCGCPPYCHALEICRVAGGPVTGGW